MVPLLLSFQQTARHVIRFQPRSQKRSNVKMKTTSLLWLLMGIVQLTSINTINAFVFGALIGTGIAAAASYFSYCQFAECCTDRWIKPNTTGFHVALKNRLFGQHLVIDTVHTAVEGHLLDESPEKALVLSFHGPTGTGKNFVSEIIARHVFKEGMNSNFVHAVFDEFRDKSQIDKYKEQLKSWVKGNVSRCERSLFIFDEMQNWPVGLLDELTLFLGHHQKIRGVDYRKSIFIFLSDIGSSNITEEVLKNRKAGKERQDINAAKMDQLIREEAFNRKGALWHSTLINKHLIDYFVPFLPLNRTHVKACIRAEMEKQKYPVAEEDVERVANELVYYPKNTRDFSTSGCKKIRRKVNFLKQKARFHTV